MDRFTNGARSRVVFVSILLSMLLLVAPSFSVTVVAQTNDRPTPAVFPLSVISAERAEAVLRAVFPHARFSVNSSANVVIATASPDDEQQMRTIIQGIDVKSPLDVVSDVIVARMNRDQLATTLRAAYPHAEIASSGKDMLLVRARSADLAAIKTLAATVDQPAATPTPVSTEAVRVMQASAQSVARAIASQINGVRASVSGSNIVLSGTPDAISRAKGLLAQLDVPTADARLPTIYRVLYVDANSVASFLSRSFPAVGITVDPTLNAITITARQRDQVRIADALKQLDVAPTANQGSYGGSNYELVTLRSAVPSASSGNNAGSDPTQSIIATLQQLIPNVRVSALATPGQIVLSGDRMSIDSAKSLLATIDVPASLVVLDTEVLELDETIARNLGLQLGTSLSTTYSELTPGTSGNDNLRLIGFQPLSRTALSLPATLNLLIQNGTARVLADPRITTLSGHTATIRAGDTINILTTVGGGTGTVATTQLQSFQTGVQLDITPLVMPNADVTVALHPVVNSLTGLNNGVPQISTRDTQTVVHLKDNQTLAIGGLIQESTQNTVSKIPLLGDLPLVGPVFRNGQTQSTRNELVIVVTPHVIKDGAASDMAGPGPALPTPPIPHALPTLAPNTKLAPPNSNVQPRAAAAAIIPPPPPAPPIAPQSTGRSTPNATPASASTPAALQNNSATGPGSSPSSALPPGPGAIPAAPPDTIVYGQEPQTTVVRSTDPAKIFAATVKPSIWQPGANVAVTATTSNNVTQVTFGYGTTSITLGPTSPGHWQGFAPFQATALPPGATNATVTLTAAKIDGTTNQITMPVRIGS